MITLAYIILSIFILVAPLTAIIIIILNLLKGGD